MFAAADGVCCQYTPRQYTGKRTHAHKHRDAWHGTMAADRPVLIWIDVCVSCRSAWRLQRRISYLVRRSHRTAVEYKYTNNSYILNCSSGFWILALHSHMHGYEPMQWIACICGCQIRFVCLYGCTLFTNTHLRYMHIGVVCIVNGDIWAVVSYDDGFVAFLGVMLDDAVTAAALVVILVKFEFKRMVRHCYEIYVGLCVLAVLVCSLACFSPSLSFSLFTFLFMLLRNTRKPAVVRGLLQHSMVDVGTFCGGT